MTILHRAITDAYRAIMDPTVNPLTNLPAGQRFQIMVYLGTMWTVIFCVGTGAWLWFGQLVVLHQLVAMGLLITGLTFRSASNERTRVLAEIRRPMARGIHSAARWTGS
jgi:Flp pilus assembly protein TadB